MSFESELMSGEDLASLLSKMEGADVRNRRVRNAAHKDANHDELASYWCSLGGTWEHTYQIAGALDGIAGFCGVDVRVEIKNLDAERGKAQAGRLTQAEQDTIQAWRGRTPAVWTCHADVERTRAELLGVAKALASARAPRYHWDAP